MPLADVAILYSAEGRLKRYTRISIGPVSRPYRIVTLLSEYIRDGIDPLAALVLLTIDYEEL